MLDTICTRLFDILQADPRLILDADGDPYLTEVRRCKLSEDFGESDATQNPMHGCVNLYDWSYEQNAGDMRPAIYCGTKNYEASDRKGTPVVGGNQVRFMIASVPIVVVANYSSRVKSRAVKSQLLNNVKHILLSDANRRNDLWYNLDISQVSPAKGINSGGGTASMTQSDGYVVVDCYYKTLQGDLRA